MTLKQFYQENQWSILCVAAGIALIAMYAFLRFIYKNPYFLNDDYTQGRKEPEPLMETDITHDDNRFIQQMFNEKWAIIASIRDSVSMEQLKAISNQIVNFYNYHSLMVDTTTVKTHTEIIYEFHSKRTMEIKEASPHKTST